MKFWTDFRPATGALTALVLFLAVGAAAQTTNVLSDAEIQGHQLAQQLCEARPVENFTNTGILQIRGGNGNRTNIPVKFKVIVTADDWRSVYEIIQTNVFVTGESYPTLEKLFISHNESQTNNYRDEIYTGDIFATRGHRHTTGVIGMRSGNELNQSFAGSDFWLCDLGLEFFHWPAQKVLPKTTNLKRGRDYTLLESTNPNPATNGYSRVLSWIDKETGGILAAEAYDYNGRLLKEFAPKSFKKVNGQWELQEMEIDNGQTGSRTRLEFDLQK
jgi:hypothetical protein